MTIAKGLEGIVAAESSISSIIDDQLTYAGYSIEDLADQASFEEVIFLLWNLHLPNKTELMYLKNELAANAEIPQEMIGHFKSYPINEVHPMAALRTAVSMLSLYDVEADDTEVNYQKAIRVLAKVPTLIAAFARVRKGLEPVSPNRDFGFAENFLYMMTGEKPSPLAVRTLDLALVLHADHELNASTFTARVCVATLTDIYSGVTAAIGALKGPLHGGANEAVMNMLKEIGSIDQVESYVADKIEKKQKLMGFGHRVYKNGDPRAKYLKAVSRDLAGQTGDTKWFEMSDKIEEVFVAEKGIKPNVDFYSATVYHSLGIDHDLFTPIFVISRTSGWLAHILEQYADNRLFRPRAEYVGPGLQKYIPIEER